MSDASRASTYSRLVQPPQCLPKQYPQWLVGLVREQYEAGASQVEIAELTGLSQKIVWRLMRNHGIQGRVASKRDQAGANNASWAGDAATYAALHKRVEVARGLAKDGRCVTCHEPAKDWANLTGRYEDTTDYERMCRSCHRAYDDRQRDPSTGRYV